MMTALLVLAAIALFVTFCASVGMLALGVVIARDQQATLAFLKVAVGRMGVIEHAVTTLNGLFAGMLSERNRMYSNQQTFAPPSQPAPPPPAPRPHINEVFETEDGRHQAPTFRELMEKVFRDPRYKVPKPEDEEKLRKLFQQHTEQVLPPPEPTPDEILDEEFEEDQGPEEPPTDEVDDSFEEEQNGPQ